VKTEGELIRTALASDPSPPAERGRRHHHSGLSPATYLHLPGNPSPRFRLRRHLEDQDGQGQLAFRVVAVADDETEVRFPAVGNLAHEVGVSG
jgi:hypothetical protein